MRSTHYVAGVDYLRGLAILLVLGIHFFDFKASIAHAPNHSLAAIYRIFGHGYYGVHLFFVISGFLIASSSLEFDRTGAAWIDAGRFYIRRATRIIPLVAVTVSIYLAVRVYGAPSFAFDYTFRVVSPASVPAMVASIATFTFNWYQIFVGPETRPFGLVWVVLWSLSVEEQFYLLFPLVILTLRSVRKLRTVALILTLCAIIARIVTLSLGFNDVAVNMNTVSCLDALSVGVFVATTRVWSGFRSKVAMIVGGMLFLVSYVLPYDAFYGVPVFGMTVAAALIIQGFRWYGEDVPWIVRFAGWPLAPLGRLSYGAYLLHAALLYCVASWLLTPMINPMLGFALFALLVYAAAYVSFRFFERPVEQILRARWSRRPEPLRSEGHQPI